MILTYLFVIPILPHLNIVDGTLGVHILERRHAVSHILGNLDEVRLKVPASIVSALLRTPVLPGSIVEPVCPAVGNHLSVEVILKVPLSRFYHLVPLDQVQEVKCLIDRVIVVIVNARLHEVRVKARLVNLKLNSCHWLLSGVSFPSQVQVRIA